MHEAAAELGATVTVVGEVQPIMVSEEGEPYADMPIAKLAGRHTHYQKLARSGDAVAKATEDYLKKLIDEKRGALK